MPLKLPNNFKILDNEIDQLKIIIKRRISRKTYGHLTDNDFRKIARILVLMVAMVQRGHAKEQLKQKKSHGTVKEI